MATRKLTQRFIDGVTPGTGVTYYWHSEAVHHGARLGLKVTPAGAKVFVCKYRPVGGRGDAQRWLKLSATTLAGAVQEVREEFRAHQDPALALREQRVAETVGEAIPLFLSEQVGKLKPQTLYEWTRILGGTHAGRTHEGYVAEALGKLRVRDVDETTIATLHRRVRNAGGEGRAPRPVMANRVLGALSAFFAWCEARGLRARGTNPAQHIARYPEQARERFLSAEEVQRLADVLRTAETTGLLPASRLRKRSPNPDKKKHRPKKADQPRVADSVAVAAIRFLIFSGFREQEALSLRWDAIDFTRGMVTLADTKTQRSTRPLGAAALDVLAGCPKQGDYVFPGAIPGRPRREVRRVWYAAREAAGLETLRLHDLRHTVASWAASGGTSLPLIAAMLGHRDMKSTQRYAHLVESAKKDAADRTTGDLLAAMEGRATPVTPIRAAQ